MQTVEQEAEQKVHSLSPRLGLRLRYKALNTHDLHVRAVLWPAALGAPGQLGIKDLEAAATSEGVWHFPRCDLGADTVLLVNKDTQVCTGTKPFVRSENNSEAAGGLHGGAAAIGCSPEQSCGYTDASALVLQEHRGLFQ